MIDPAAARSSCIGDAVIVCAVGRGDSEKREACQIDFEDFSRDP